jgi:hypothetical protein
MLNIVLENLQLKNKYELKDKYEGDAYFNNILISYFGFKAIYSFQGKNEYINNLKIDEYIKGEIMINNLTFKISNFQFGTLPKFEPIKNESINGVIFCLYRDKDVYLCGYINTKEYNQTKTRFFENFYLLKSIDKI